MKTEFIHLDDARAAVASGVAKTASAALRLKTGGLIWIYRDLAEVGGFSGSDLSSLRSRTESNGIIHSR